MWWLWAWAHASVAVAADPGDVRGARPAPSLGEHADTTTYPAGTRRGGEKAPSHTSADPPVPDADGPKVMLRDEDVVRALEQRQPSFLRCYRIAQRKDPFLVTAQVVLHVSVGPSGAVDDATLDGGTSIALDECLLAVARHLSFPAPLQPVQSQLKLFFTP